MPRNLQPIRAFVLVFGRINEVEVTNCLTLLIDLIRIAFSLAADKAGNNIAARIAMMAITTSNSISVNPRLVSAGLPAADNSRTVFFEQVILGLIAIVYCG